MARDEAHGASGEQGIRGPAGIAYVPDMVSGHGQLNPWDDDSYLHVQH
jgi:hypothetical protein